MSYLAKSTMEKTASKFLKAIAEGLGIATSVAGGSLAAVEVNRRLKEKRWLNAIKENPAAQALGAAKLPDKDLLSIYRSSVK